MADPTIAELLAPETLARIDDYSLVAKTAVEGFISGLHRSLFQGFGSEFFQYREYVPGDDLKYADWKIFGKRDKLYTKVFQEETNMDCSVVLDSSASMGYRGDRAPCSKLKYACMTAACLAYLASRQGDNVGLYAYSDGLTSSIPPAHRSGGLRRILTELYALEPAGQADYGEVMGYVAEKCRHRGVVIILSDLLEAEDSLSGILKRFRFTHHECIVLQVLDPDELDFPFDTTTRFVDSEKGNRIVTFPPLVQHSYNRQMDEFLETVRISCLEQEVDYLLLSTANDLGNTLAAYLHRREAMS